MKQALRVIIVFLFVFFISCSKKTDVPVSDVKTISITDSELNEKYAASDLFERVEFIPLETSDDCLVGTVSKIKITDNYFYILDAKSNAVFIFDRAGKYLKKINTIGLGPDEYLHIDDISVSVNGELIILDAGYQKVLFYDGLGNLKNVYRIPFFADAIESLNDTLYVLNGSSTEDRVIIWDRYENTKVNSFLKFDPKYSARIFTPLISYKDDIYFTYNNTSFIHKVTASSLTKEWFVDFGKRNIQEDELKKNKQGFTTVPASACDLSYFIETDNYVTFSFQCEELDELPYFVCYSKSSQTKRVYTYKNYMDDMTFYGYPLDFVSTTVDEQFVIPYSAYDLLTQVQLLGEQKMDSDTQQRYATLLNRLQDINEFDNPIIAFYTLKQF